MQSGLSSPKRIGGHPRIIKRHREGEYGNLSHASNDPETNSRLHTPVLLQESVDALGLGRFSSRYVVIDATLGEGGHAREILRRLPEDGKLVGIERDPRMLAALTLTDPRLIAVEGNFRETTRILKSLNLDWAHGILADLGLSAKHYQTPEWGFSFTDGPLDMRLGTTGLTAADIVNEWSEQQLGELLLGAGDRHGRKIAKGLVEARKIKAIRRTGELAELVSSILGSASGRRPSRRSKSHPATKVFRALREAVTGELADLRALISESSLVLAPPARLAILTYTWEEERIVRTESDALVKGCICPPSFPVCRCGRKPVFKWVTRKGIRPAEDEVRRNPSARSGRLFVIEKI